LATERPKKRRHGYAPRVEALEALRLLSGSATPTLPHLVVEHEMMPGAIAPVDPPQVPDSTWDAALGQTRLAEILGQGATASDQATIQSGLSQLDRYLARTWYRAGIALQQHDDCTQAVYATLLQNLGRDRFDNLVSDVGQHGIRDVLSRETPEGPDFFRAIDTVKKRAQREKSFQPLDGQADTVATSASQSDADRRGALHEVIARQLNPREAALIYETLKGATPAEIAHQWGVAPKTVSNEKTRVFQKLRDALGTSLSD
jgi:DNA-binding CsgD family transcriptional regulator